MEVNQEGNKEEKYLDVQKPRDVGKEKSLMSLKRRSRFGLLGAKANSFLYLQRNQSALWTTTSKRVERGGGRLTLSTRLIASRRLKMFTLSTFHQCKTSFHIFLARLQRTKASTLEFLVYPKILRTIQRHLKDEFQSLPLMRGLAKMKDWFTTFKPKAIDQGRFIADIILEVLLHRKTLHSLVYTRTIQRYLAGEYKIEKSLLTMQANATILDLRIVHYEPKMLHDIKSFSRSLPSTPTSQPSPAELASRSVPSVSEYDAIYTSTTATPTSLSERMKEKSTELESLILELNEIPETRLQKEPRKRRWRRSLKRELTKVWKELRILKKESEQEQVDKRWSIQEEVANLFDLALKFSYPQFKDEKSKILACIPKYGDYQCENVLSIWPKLRKEGTVHLGPRRVGWKIKENLELLRPGMLEREPWVLDIGFVSIKLSGKWMAKSIHKMLKDGIDTWAPKLLMKSVLVKFPSCGIADLMPIDLLRREFIKTTLIRMLEYCKVGVEFLMPCGVALPKEQTDKFQFQERDGDVLIFRNNAEGEQEPLIHAKRDGCSGIPMKDLADLWYGLKEKNADWLVCLTPVQQQEYIKMCIKAAQHAKWLPRNWRDSPRASYTGYQTYNTKLKHEDLDSLLEAAKYNCDAAAKELGYTSEEVLNCALKYTILKIDRLADYTCNSQEMLNAKENTFVYLLNTQARIRSFTEESRKDIDDLVSKLEFELGKDEIWKEGVERVLVQHLLSFTQVIEESCLSVLPHILCQYLYDLSKNFNCVYEVDFVSKTTKLLLCEATRVVMEKCFHLLGITPESSSFRVDFPRASSLGLTKYPLPLDKDPLKITTRFELFSVYPHITRDPDFREGNLFGQIEISDTYSLLSDGWGQTSVPDHGYVALFDCDWPYSIEITNHRAVYFGNPSSRNLVPFSSFMEVRVELYASTERNDAVFELCNCNIDVEFDDFLRGDADTRRSMWIIEGKDGHIRMYYILLKDAIDSTIKVMYHPQKYKEDNGGGEVFAEIFAYYGSDFFDKKVDPFEKNYYTVRLFRSSFDSNTPEIPLEKSRLAVPAKGSIEIVARLWDVDSGDMILNGCWTFHAGCADEQKKDESCGSLHVSVDWS